MVLVPTMKLLNDNLEELKEELRKQVLKVKKKINWFTLLRTLGYGRASLSRASGTSGTFRGVRVGNIQPSHLPGSTPAAYQGRGG